MGGSLYGDDMQQKVQDSVNPPLAWSKKAQGAIDDWLERNVSTPMFNAGLTNLGPETGAIGSAAASLVLPQTLYDLAPAPPWMKLIKGEGKGVGKAAEQAVERKVEPAAAAEFGKPLAGNMKKPPMTKDEVLAVLKNNGGVDPASDMSSKIRGGGDIEKLSEEKRLKQLLKERRAEAGFDVVTDENAEKIAAGNNPETRLAHRSKVLDELAENHRAETYGQVLGEEDLGTEAWRKIKGEAYAAHALYYGRTEERLGRRMKPGEVDRFRDEFMSMPEGPQTGGSLPAREWDIPKDEFGKVLRGVRIEAEEGGMAGVKRFPQKHFPWDPPEPGRKPVEAERPRTPEEAAEQKKYYEEQSQHYRDMQDE